MHFQKSDLEQFTEERLNTLDAARAKEICRLLRDDMNALYELLDQNPSEEVAITTPSEQSPL